MRSFEGNVLKAGTILQVNQKQAVGEGFVKCLHFPVRRVMLERSDHFHQCCHETALVQRIAGERSSGSPLCMAEPHARYMVE